MDKVVDVRYVVTGVVTVSKCDRPAFIVFLCVFCLVRLNAICGHVWRV